MIDEKKIEDAADICRATARLADEPKINGAFNIGFKVGFKKFKEVLWHSPSEEPSLDEYHQIVLEWYENAAGRKDKMRYAIIDNNYLFWSSVLSTYAIVKRWFYLDDLL